MTGALLSTAQMAQADRLTVAGGVPGIALMEAAGRAVAERVSAARPAAPVAVLCGPGNNGGDGFVAARLLAARGHAVNLFLLGDRAALKGDAALAAGRWEGPVTADLGFALAGAGAVVDAIFGAGLSRPFEGGIAAAVKASGAYVVAVDVPSGVDGNSGAVPGEAIAADETVTFFRKKPGHLLFPGRALAGKVFVADIGIGSQVLDTIEPDCFENEPALWRAAFPVPDFQSHKYKRGHVAVAAGGPLSTGAARLAARGALRAGAGLVTLMGAPEASLVLAQHVTAIMVRCVHAPEDFKPFAAARRVNAVILGPGQGVGEETRSMVAAAREMDLLAVLDADALTSCADAPDTIFGYGRAVLTPHDGEFARLFPDLTGDRLTRARAAAARAGAVVLLKGADTAIARPDGRAAINANAPPWLGTAGAGDVLAGFIGALLAQGMAPFDAACAGAWLHGAAARTFGPGLIAEDLPEILPQVLRSLLDEAGPAEIPLL